MSEQSENIGDAPIEVMVRDVVTGKSIARSINDRHVLVELDLDAAKIFVRVVKLDPLIEADTEAARLDESARKPRWRIGAAIMACIGAALSGSLAFFGVDATLGTPIDVTATGWIGTATVGASIVLAAAVISHAALLIIRMRDVSATADDLESARRHLDRAAEQMAIVQRFRDLRGPAGGARA